MTQDRPLGPLMLDIGGLELTEEDRRLLREPEVGGLILFSRNYANLTQLQALVAKIRRERPDILIAVDHEGGRVQRFRDEFTRLPPMAVLGRLWERDAERARRLAFGCGWLMAAELLAVGIDISFAPVLDRDHGRSQVIGDRAFSARNEVIQELAGSLIDGMARAGMAATGKHFPGHGFVEADSHLAIPHDERPWSSILADDLPPFIGLIQSNRLAGIMPAHVIYDQVDSQPAGFSRYWLQAVLRQQLGFEGVIFSDDLSMEGAVVAGSYRDRADAALDAGCDMVLVCNDRPGALEVLARLKERELPDGARLARMRGRFGPDWQALRQSPEWREHRAELEGLAGPQS